jgi:hypothetical protein
MDCEKIKEIIPRYIQHSATQEEIETIEEHLCICHNCRMSLSKAMDKKTTSQTTSLSSEKGEKKRIDFLEYLTLILGIIFIFIFLFLFIKK